LCFTEKVDFMAIAATPITRGKGLLDLLQQTVPFQERAVELYRRLLAINALSNSMNSARNVEHLKSFLSSYFQECFPEEQVRLCLVDGVNYQIIRLSGPSVPKDEKIVPLSSGIAGSVIRSATPLWIPDTHPAKRQRKYPEFLGETPWRSIMVFPFSALGKTVGCIEMISNRPNRFDEIEYHLGSLVSAHLSSSLDNVLTKQELANANARLKDHDQRLTQLNEKLKELAHTDECTGLFNKRRLFDHLEMEIARAKRYGEIFGCLMIDIDDFKKINDTYGHQAGDEVLKQTGALLRRSLRVTDFVARYGGEEFTIILPRTNSAGASRVAENLLSNFSKNEFEIGDLRTHLTVSIGVACCTTFACLDAREIIWRADNALYEAKRAGKNRACFANERDMSYEDVRNLSNM
jgi:diguanylate cyclase (GGDEF)-like protein